MAVILADGSTVLYSSAADIPICLFRQSDYFDILVRCHTLEHLPSGLAFGMD